MDELERLVVYESLKFQYLQQFPSLQAENMINMEERLSGEEDEEEEVLLPSNPIQRRDARIAELEKNTEEVSSMKEQMTKLNAELSLAKKNTFLAKKKLNFARTVTEQRLKECLPVPSFKDEHSSVLITLMSTLMDEDCLEIDPATEILRPKDDLFKEIEESFLDDTDDVIKERLNFVRNKLIERVQASASKSKERRLSFSSSIGSQDSKKRKNSTELENDQVRNRSSSQQ